MRNLVFVALLATAALSMGCNGIHKRHGGGCPGGACGGGGCPDGACGQYAGGPHGGGCPDGNCGGYGGHGGHGGILGHGGPGGPGGQHGMHGVPHHFSREYAGPPGPPSAQVAYPYYTTRGPRDYFANEPMSIGP
jgi:hypothetical protein